MCKRAQRNSSDLNGCGDPGAMLSRVAHSACGEDWQETRPRRGVASLVYALRLRLETNPPTGVTEAPAQVFIFAIHEKALVEPA
jgi:hypothetical protein